MGEEEKERLVARFRDYLDHTELANEGSDYSVPDLFTLLSEITALKNEVKLEARQFKSAYDELAARLDAERDHDRLTSEQAAPPGETGDQAATTAETTPEQVQQDLLLELLELRDRLQAGHDQALRFSPGRRNGRTAARFVASMAEGMAMNLRRLDETLARRAVLPLPAVGQAFDPRTMYAVQQAQDPTCPHGQVVGELRKGFLYQDRLLRQAEVIVNRLSDQPREKTRPSPREEAYRSRIFWSQWSQV